MVVSRYGAEPSFWSESFCQQIMTDYRHQHRTTLLNRVARHPFNVGYDFNHESPYTKAFVDSVNNYWLTEYKLMGIDLTLAKIAQSPR